MSSSFFREGPTIDKRRPPRKKKKAVCMTREDEQTWSPLSTTKRRKVLSPFQGGHYSRREDQSGRNPFPSERKVPNYLPPSFCVIRPDLAGPGKKDFRIGRKFSLKGKRRPSGCFRRAKIEKGFRVRKGGRSSQKKRGGLVNVPLSDRGKEKMPCPGLPPGKNSSIGVSPNKRSHPP